MTVSLVTSYIRGSSIFSQKSLYKKRSHGILRELKAAFKRGASKVQRPRPSFPVCYDPSVRRVSTSSSHRQPPSPPSEREKNETNFSSCNDRNPKWIINDCYIFFPNLRVWVFLFLRTPFFKTQHFDAMLQIVLILKGMKIINFRNLDK